jgi:hypothetical protein
VTSHVFRIDVASGKLVTLDTDLIDLPAMGRRKITRASRVEFDEAKQGWVCFHPDGGAVIGGQPSEGFPVRRDALAWEHEWAMGKIIR